MSHLEAFLTSKHRNAWLKEPNLQVYVRRSFQLLNGKRKKSFDLANAIASPAGKGTFTKFLAQLEQKLSETDFELIFIENVIEERLRNFFLRQGYEAIETGGITQCFRKELTR